MKIPIRNTLLATTLSVAVAAGVFLGVSHMNSAGTEASDNNPAQSICVTTDLTLRKTVEDKASHHKTTGRSDLEDMFARTMRTMHGKDNYTVADIKARPDKQGANWQGNGPSPLWQSIYTELNRLETCRANEPERRNLSLDIPCWLHERPGNDDSSSFCVKWDHKNGQYQHTQINVYAGAAVNATPWNLASLRAQPGVSATATWNDFKVREGWITARSESGVGWTKLDDGTTYLVTVEGRNGNSLEGKGAHLKVQTRYVEPATMTGLTAKACDDDAKAICLEWTTSTSKILNQFVILGWSAKEEGVKTKVGYLPDAKDHHVHEAVYVTDTTKRSHRVSNLEYNRWHRFEVNIWSGAGALQPGKVAVAKTGANPIAAAKMTGLTAEVCEDDDRAVCLNWTTSTDRVVNRFAILNQSQGEMCRGVG